MNKINKQIYWLLVLILSSLTTVYGQREPQYTQYMYNIGSFNPAYVGSVENTEITSSYRAQWISVEGAPRTLRLGANIPFSNEKNGLGFNIIHDELGPSTQTYFDVAYSFQVKLSDETKLSFGIDAGGSLLNVDYSKGSFEVINEPLINSNTLNKFYPTVGAGAFLYGENWYTGVSVPNFLTDVVYNDEVSVYIEDKPQFNFIGGYVFDISDGLKFKPAFLLNYLEGLPLNANISTNFLISDIVTLGASYRFDNAVSALAGLQLSNSLFVGYSYDYNVNGYSSSYNDGSHELVLKFYFGRKNNSRNNSNKKLKGKPKQIDTPRFF
ncbi:type IX secretion system membrane protein PorP/SprF [Cellulophaga baltica]|uniref:PorP/SprF family type IX secretion system membrane protein n=1 Tax=Cellulophaga TaxID=104264 RepID=UPI001C06785E|nr:MULTISPECIES: type IX secretion system membrane protein PorP/SprF [Cellulophaga]MBU2995180.1 type IX secretion system membrane protein PorP/SprF [Cellulophaga baltica]MDO6766575.1 type IX secretion system membrane protein PorP/SprF [Cellulophaga sp. 1_MG-2023]